MKFLHIVLALTFVNCHLARASSDAWAVSDRLPINLPGGAGTLNEVWLYDGEEHVHRNNFGPLLIWIKPGGEKVLVTGSISALNSLAQALIQSTARDGGNISEREVVVWLAYLYTKTTKYNLRPRPALRGEAREHWFDSLRNQVGAERFAELRPLIKDLSEDHASRNWGISFGVVTPTGGIELIEIAGEYAPLKFTRHTSIMLAPAGSVPEFPFEPVHSDEAHLVPSKTPR
jgi:hypothetical protein